MKRYMNYPKFNAIMMGIYTLALYLFVIGLSFGTGIEGLFALLLIPTCLLIPTIAYISITVDRNKRGKIALTGKKDVGRVLSKTIVRRDVRSSWNYYLIDFEYVGENNAQLIGTAYVSSNDFGYFVEGKNIPIYVKGEYAMFNMEEVRIDFRNNENLIKKEEIKVARKTCPYCDSILDGNAMICPHCGATNFKK